MNGRTFLPILLTILLSSPANADIATADSARAAGDYDSAIAEYRSLAQSGNAVAQATLGYMLYVGEGITQDHEQAVNWYRQAATQGNADAQYNLAVAYAFGEGVGLDFAEAVNWYTQAAEQNHAIAQYSLGLSYSYGEGVARDPENAVYWFSRSAENGYVRGQALLASKYHTGDGVSLDYQQAAHWYREAAEQGDAIAQFNLGSMYRSGTGVTQDTSEAMRWYQLSSQQGYTAATDELLNLERTLVAQSNIQQTTSDITALPDNSGVDEIQDLPALQQAGDGEPDVITGLRIDEGPLAYAATEVPAAGVQALEPVAVEEASETVAGGLEYSELMNMDNLDPSLPDETSAAAEVLLSTDSEMEQIQEADMELAETEENTQTSGGFFSRLFSRRDNQTNQESDAVVLAQDNDNELMDEPMPADISDIGEPENNSEMIDSEQISSIEEEQVESRGFFRRLFSRSSDQDENEVTEPVIETNSESNNTEQLAMTEQDSIIEMPVEQVAEMNFDSLDTLYGQGLSELANNNYGDAVRLFRSAAAQGDPMAQYQLGTLYYQGLGLNQNYSEAALWYRRAAEQGNVDAQYSLGNMYLMGEGISQNDVQARYWYTEAATHGHTSAKHNLENLERFSQSNELVTVDVSEEITAIDDTLTMDLEQAVETTPEEIIEEQPTETIVASIEPAVQSDAPSSLATVDYERGLSYSFGEGVTKNLKSAFEYFKSAAEKNYAPAQYKLGVAYAYAEGTEQDKSEAVYWYQKAALQGHAIAQRNLGVMYENGDGVVQNKELALAWYSILADSGNLMDIRRMQTLSRELSTTEIESAEQIKTDLLAEINNARF